MSFSRRTINRWLLHGVPDRSWARVLRELAPSQATARRWLREGIPESTLRRLERPRAPVKRPSKPQATPHEALEDIERESIAAEPPLSDDYDEGDEPPISDTMLIDYGDLPQVKVFGEDFDEFEAEEIPEIPGEDYDLDEEYDLDYWEEVAEYYDDIENDFADFEKLS